MSSLFDRYQVPASEVSVLLTTDEHIRELNRDFRGKDEATDVLTFPGPKHGPLGDIAISVDTAAKQAKHRGDNRTNEIVFLSIHGGLHLLGFEDETDAGRDDMVRRMNEVALDLGMKVDPDWSSLPHESDDSQSGYLSIADGEVGELANREGKSPALGLTQQKASLSPPGSAPASPTSPSAMERLTSSPGEENHGG